MKIKPSTHTRPPPPDPNLPYVWLNDQWFLLATDTGDGVPRKLDLPKALVAGDVAGHEFHGNQWTGGQGSEHESLSYRSIDALKDYKGFGYGVINEALRDPEAASKFSDAAVSTAKQEIQAMDEAFRCCAQHLEQDTWVYRNIRPDVEQELERAGRFRDNGFVSTSTDRNNAWPGKLTAILLPAGTAVMPMDQFGGSDVTRNENELLLNRGSEFDRTGEGTWKLRS